MGGIREVDHKQYRVPMAGHSAFHKNLAWYATDDDRVLGVVVEDLVDHDFSWVVLTKNAQSWTDYTYHNGDHSLPTQQAATDRLHTAMRETKDDDATEK